MSPEISVIVPTYERPEALRGCLRSLYKSDFPMDRFEIVVVDDGSSTSYKSVKEEFPAVHWAFQQNAGPGAARNLGASLARGRYLAFTDDDCHPDGAWLSQLQRALKSNPRCLVGGSTPAAPQANLYDQVSQFITDLVYRHYNSQPERSQFFASNNIALPASLFSEIGGFCLESTVTAAEDRTLCNHLLSRGHRLVWNREALVYHHPRLDFRRFCAMYIRYGRGAYAYQKGRHEGSMLSETNFHLNLPRNVREALGVYPELPVPRTLALLGVWQICNFAGFFWQSIQGNRF